MAAELVILHELVDINVLVGSTFMRRKLNRNDAFFEVVIPTYSVDEFKSHFRMTKGTLEKLCREVAAMGTILEGNRYGRPPIPVQCHVLAFVWFMANSEVMRSVSDCFNITLSSLSSYSTHCRSLYFRATTVYQVAYWYVYCLPC